MFAIYNIRGRRFRDTLENLRKVDPIQSRLGVELQADTTNDEIILFEKAIEGKSDKTIVSQKALQAYRNVCHINQHEPIYHAHQLMSDPVKTVPMDMEIITARRYFQQQKFQQIPVLNSQHKIVGILSIKDLLQFIIIDGEKIQYLDGKRVADAMSKEVITADPVSDIRRIAQVMREYHLSGVPIVNKKDKLIGIVSRSDILRAVTNDPPLNMWS
jgi:acetoin utilization protein AcuB